MHPRVPRASRVALFAGAAILAACTSAEQRAADSAMRTDSMPAPSTDSTAAAMRTDSGAMSGAGGASASAPIKDASGRDLGTLTVSESGGMLMLMGSLKGLPPGEHGIHLHAKGVCDAPKFEGAGPHWNPTNKKHGTENPDGPHMGDALNITVGADSSATVHVMTPAGGMLMGANGVMDTDGAAIVVHATRDDYRTDPSGNSGGRIACGIAKGA